MTADKSTVRIKLIKQMSAYKDLMSAYKDHYQQIYFNVL